MRCLGSCAKRHSCLLGYCKPSRTPAASLWEIAIKVSLEKLYLPKPYDELFLHSVPDSGLTLLSIEPRHLNAVSRLPLHHRDPFDRLLVAQAQTDGLTVITCDPRFPAYGVPLLW